MNTEPTFERLAPRADGRATPPAATPTARSTTSSPSRAGCGRSRAGSPSSRSLPCVSRPSSSPARRRCEPGLVLAIIAHPRGAGGDRRRRVPWCCARRRSRSPTGPAGNGVLAVAVGWRHRDGRRRRAKVDTRSRPVPAATAMPAYSRDGTRVAFLRSEPGATTQQPHGRRRRRHGPGRAPRRSSSSVQAFDWSPAATDWRCSVTSGSARRRPSSWPRSDGSAWSELDLGPLDPERLGRMAPADGRRAGLPGQSRERRSGRGPVRRRTGRAGDRGSLMEPAMAEPSDPAAVGRARTLPGRAVRHVLDLGHRTRPAMSAAGGASLDLETGDVRIATTWGGSPSPVTPGRSNYVVGVGASTGDRAASTGRRLRGPSGRSSTPDGIHIAVSPDGTTSLVTGERPVPERWWTSTTGAATPLERDLGSGLLSWQRIALP